MISGSHNSIGLIKEFPAHNSVEFDGQAHWSMYRAKNIIVDAKASTLYCQKHWGSLSVKAAFRGVEYYTTQNSKYLVSENNYLILNQDTVYSSFIDSDMEVESFTVHFSPDFVNNLISGLMSSPEILFNMGIEKNNSLQFIEKTYPHDNLITPVLRQIHGLTGNFEFNKNRIEELLYCLLYNMLLLDANVKKEVNKVDAMRFPVKLELYKKLNYAKEYIDSCFDQNISLDTISGIACMNSEYFLRQFKKHFSMTPIQYLIRKRLEVAKQIIGNSDMSISEVCRQVGYSDLTSFGKLFRKFYHTTPGAFRKIHIRA